MDDGECIWLLLNIDEGYDNSYFVSEQSVVLRVMLVSLYHLGIKAPAHFAPSHMVSFCRIPVSSRKGSLHTLRSKDHIM